MYLILCVLLAEYIDPVCSVSIPCKNQGTPHIICTDLGTTCCCGITMLGTKCFVNKSTSYPQTRSCCDIYLRNIVSRRSRHKRLDRTFEDPGFEDRQKQFKKRFEDAKRESKNSLVGGIVGGIGLLLILLIGVVRCCWIRCQPPESDTTYINRPPILFSARQQAAMIAAREQAAMVVERQRDGSPPGNVHTASQHGQMYVTPQYWQQQNAMIAAHQPDKMTDMELVKSIQQIRHLPKTNSQSNSGGFCNPAYIQSSGSRTLHPLHNTAPSMVAQVSGQASYILSQRPSQQVPHHESIIEPARAAHHESIAEAPSPVHSLPATSEVPISVQVQSDAHGHESTCQHRQAPTTDQHQLRVYPEAHLGPTNQRENDSSLLPSYEDVIASTSSNQRENDLNLLPSYEDAVASTL